MSTVDDVLTELKVLSLEMRTGFAESRARDAELTLRASEQATRLSTLIDSIVDLIREYLNHTHPDG